MSMLKITLDDSYGDTGVGYFGLPWLNGTNALYAGYVSGDGYYQDANKDYGPNGIDITASGSAVVTDGYFTSSPTSYFDVPFTADALAAAGIVDEMTIIAVVRHANSLNSMFVSAFDPADSTVFTTLGMTPTVKRVRATRNAPFVSTEIDASDNADDWEIVACTLTRTTQTAHRWVAGVRTDDSDAYADNDVGGAQLFKIGSHQGTVTTYSGSVDIAAAAFYSEALSTTELDAIVADVRTFLSAYGIDA